MTFDAVVLFRSFSLNPISDSLSALMFLAPRLDKSFFSFIKTAARACFPVLLARCLFLAFCILHSESNCIFIAIGFTALIEARRRGASHLHASIRA